jgi:hypothetical protein
MKKIESKEEYDEKRAERNSLRDQYEECSSIIKSGKLKNQINEYDVALSNWEFNNKEKSTRELALERWNNLEAFKCDQLSFPRNKISLTGREIEEIWRKETQAIPEHALGCNPNEYEIDKPNQKQFKEFNPKLFLQYINKFSLKDRYNAIGTLLLTTNLSIDAINEICNILGKYQKLIEE